MAVARRWTQRNEEEKGKGGRECAAWVQRRVRVSWGFGRGSRVKSADSTFPDKTEEQKRGSDRDVIFFCFFFLAFFLGHHPPHGGEGRVGGGMLPCAHLGAAETGRLGEGTQGHGGGRGERSHRVLCSRARVQRLLREGTKKCTAS